MTQEQISNTESAYLDSVARLRTLEGRYNLLRDRVLVVNNNLIEQYKKTVTEVKSVNDDIKEIKSDLFKIKEAMRHLLSELELFAKKDDVKYLEKYINLDPTARDTLFAWFTPSVESTIEKWKDGYAICCYTTEYLPAEGRCLFRYSLLMEMIGCEKRFRELDCLYLLTQAGHNRYAYVPNPGFYHKQIRTLAELRRKRMRNAIKNYIPGQVEGYIKYTWFDLYKPLDFLKMCALIFYAFSVIGPVLGGIWKSLKYQTYCGMVEAVYVPVAVEAYLEAFVRTKQGRLFVLRTFKGLFFRDKT